jgi:hypothetical protein
MHLQAILAPDLRLTLTLQLKMQGRHVSPKTNPESGIDEKFWAHAVATGWSGKNSDDSKSSTRPTKFWEPWDTDSGDFTGYDV